ncbi:MAG: DNA-deoxyinosine glycosylase [Flavobacteriia bacterium]|nr:DNA-deoxyinosine glycosylase [Flavobacteriia bacterium]
MKTAFAPIIDSESKILILGTMPGIRSLELQQYYGHTGNHFWKILFSLFDEPFTKDYEKRIDLLHRKHIALWDVLSHCEGEGSADTAIRNEVANDFKTFYTTHPHIQHVFWSCRHAEKFYKKHVGMDPSKNYTLLPSPSGAYASMPLEKKIEKWSVMLELLNER